MIRKSGVHKYYIVRSLHVKQEYRSLIMIQDNKSSSRKGNNHKVKCIMLGFKR